MKKRYPISILFFLLALLFNCQEIPSNSNNDDPPVQTTVVSGQVILENQDEHSNCAIFDSALTMLTGSDSSGNYFLDFKDQYREYNGSVTLIYYLLDYDPDTATVFLNNGFMQSDILSVNELGEIDPIFLNQLIKLKAWTSDSLVVVGDSITYTAKYTNLTDETIQIAFYSIETGIGGLGGVTIIQGPFNYWYPFTEFPFTTFEQDLHISIIPGGSYSGSHIASFPSGRFIGGVFHPMPSGSYTMSSDLFYDSEDFYTDSNIISFFLGNWEFHHRGDIPTCPLPQKYKLPRIEVEN